MVLLLILAITCLLIHLRPRLPRIVFVTRVVDGDTAEVRGWISSYRIRLAGIDAPEWKQPHGYEAYLALCALMEQRYVLIMPKQVDVYRRTLCSAFAGARSVSCHMALAGHAWGTSVLTVLLSVPPRLGRRGLWAHPKPVEPRVWRIAQRPLPCGR